ncbi:MAG: hypothetical protein AAGK28_15825 [Pseudomonadota bacterium]
MMAFKVFLVLLKAQDSTLNTICAAFLVGRIKPALNAPHPTPGAYTKPLLPRPALQKFTTC